MEIKNFSFKYKIIILIIALIIILTITTILIITNTTNEILKDTVVNNQQSNTQQQAELISSWLLERKRDLEIYANTEIMTNGSWQQKKLFTN
ncbi:hypothetical protein LJ207_11570 [Halanaerobium sp. Z-7514]|uniref:Methyl-accepting chemotaxis protein n=1 Tax=Halanaerobium polyolivorans TaxID=2886943 RepID=A0AAW4X2A6_9FIRM|nr:hypothetical protein [Halanaerobium polyolivorans]MCC3145953.1 hypothetical protein [Halanaerobium polyolivorans]RQD74182.1 MAG: hypothetical protein D5S01_06955 [Halanaerobium sp. MSAO_Bac5]